MSITRNQVLIDIFANVDEKEYKVVRELIDEVIFLEDQMQELKKLPFISVNPVNQCKQKTTAAAKLYKECSQSYMNAIRILLSLLRKEDNTEKNELLARLQEYL